MRDDTLRRLIALADDASRLATSLAAIKPHARAMPRSEASLANSVSDVVGLRPDAEVRGIDAARGVACVQDDEPERDGTVREFVGQPVRELALVVAGRRRPAGDVDVAVRERVALHQPAALTADRARR